MAYKQDEALARMEAIGRSGVTISVCCGPSGSEPCRWTVQLMSRDGDMTVLPFAGNDFIHLIEIAETEIAKRRWAKMEKRENVADLVGRLDAEAELWSGRGEPPASLLAEASAALKHFMAGPRLTDDEIEQIAEGLEHFCIGPGADEDGELARIWQPYIDKLNAMKKGALPLFPSEHS